MHRLGIPLLVLVGCGGSQPEPQPAGALRQACAVNVPTRVALYGDLHVHTGFSFDAYSYDTVLTPADAYAFGRGGEVKLAPLDAAGKGTRSAKLERPLDFLAVTDHSEFLGEVNLCSDSSSEVYESDSCKAYREDVGSGAFLLGKIMSEENPSRLEDVCGEEGCKNAAAERWQAVQVASEEAYDRSSNCAFTSFVAYEYTNTLGVSNLHRNVVFANEVVPELPVSYFEAHEPLALWQQLQSQCRDTASCDVVVLPHNSNLSNGRLFDPTYPGGGVDEKAHLELRAAMEPVAEIFQHKGDSECRNGFDDVDAEDDPACDFEKLRPPDDVQCGEETGTGGMRLWGCSHRHDFVRNVLKTGLLEAERTGVNPYRVGFIGSTDTHNGTPGNVSSVLFPGHVGLADDTADKRLGPGTVTHDGLINNPGGLAAVWAEENSREAIFAALKRRETFATSGPRLRIRLFAGWNYPSGMCEQADMLVDAYAGGVPMGGVMTGAEGAAPTLLVQAERDEGSTDQPGMLLERLQIIKGWSANGKVFESVYDVAGDAGSGSVDLNTCATDGSGAQSFCTVWTDPDFDAAQRAFYYARVLENPSCRWSTRECLALDGDLPEGCSDDTLAKTVQQRAWSSPIWFEPT